MPHSMSKGRIIALVIAVMIGGGGVGFVARMLPVWRGVAEPNSQGPGAPLRIEEPKEPVRGKTGVEGYCDLRMQNQADKPVTIRLEQTDCACARLP
jgi:hypothetical protein